MRCRHCFAASVSRPRGLCWGCYYKPGVKELYPPTSKFAPHHTRGITEDNPKHRLPLELCPHPPGSDEKIAVMAERAEAGESLFHPLDADFTPRVSLPATGGDPSETHSDGD